MDRYHIGVRLRGYAKKYLKALTCEISKSFDLGNLEEKIIPHMTLIRPFTTSEESKLIDTFEEVLSEFKKPIFYTLNGFGTFENQEKVIYAKINKNPKIEEIGSSLEDSLEGKIDYLCEKICLPSEQDRINLHCSIVSKNANEYFNKINFFVQRQSFPTLIQPLLRIYLLKNKLILREFDFYLRKSLVRWDAINPFVFDETLDTFKKITNVELSSEGIILPLPRKFRQ